MFAGGMHPKCRWDIIDHNAFCTRLLGITYHGIGLAYDTDSGSRIRRWRYGIT